MQTLDLAKKVLPLLLTFHFSVVEAKNSEVHKSSQTTISCVVNGLTKQVDTVTWEKPSGAVVVENNQEGYKINVGTFSPDTNSQTTVLTIPADKNTADSVYTCVITSNEHGLSEVKTDVNSYVYCKSH